MLCCWQVIDEALRQLLTVQAQRHATLQALPNLIQHVQSGGLQQTHTMPAPVLPLEVLTVYCGCTAAGGMLQQCARNEVVLAEAEVSFCCCQ